MRQYSKSNSLDDILDDFYKSKINYLKQPSPPIAVFNTININNRSGRKLLLNTAFTFGIILMIGIFLLTAGDKTELAKIMESAIKKTNVIEHIRSGSNNMFEFF